MPKYKLLLHGRNLYAKINGRIEKVGFYTTLIVEAETSSEAEIKAQQILEEDHRVKDLTANRPDQPFMLSVEEVEQLAANEIDIEATGFAFYIDHGS